MREKDWPEPLIHVRPSEPAWEVIDPPPSRTDAVDIEAPTTSRASQLQDVIRERFDLGLDTWAHFDSPDDRLHRRSFLVTNLELVAPVISRIYLEEDLPKVPNDLDYVLFYSSEILDRTPILKKRASSGPPCPDCGNPMLVLFTSVSCDDCNPVGAEPITPAKMDLSAIWSSYAGRPKFVNRVEDHPTTMKICDMALVFHWDDAQRRVTVIRNRTWGNVGKTVSVDSATWDILQAWSNSFRQAEYGKDLDRKVTDVVYIQREE